MAGDDDGWGTANDGGWGQTNDDKGSNPPKNTESSGGWGQDDNQSKKNDDGGWGSSGGGGGGGWGSSGGSDQRRSDGNRGGFNRERGSFRGRGRDDNRSSRNNGGGWGSSGGASDGGWGSSGGAANDGGWGSSGGGSGGGWGSSGGSDQRRSDGNRGGFNRERGSFRGRGRDDNRSSRNDDGGWGSSGGGSGKDDNQSNKNDDGGWGSSSGGWGQDDNKASKDDDGGWGSSNGDDQGGFGRDRGSFRGRGGPDKRNSFNDDDRPNKKFKREGDDIGESDAERPAPFKPEETNLDEEANLLRETAGENFDKYNDHLVTCMPPDAICPIEKFEDIIKSKLLLNNIKKLNYDKMTPIQKWAMPAIMDENDLIACAQTGSGKTAAFLLPIMQKLLNSELDPHDPNADCQYPYCLIISPTRELAKQLCTQAELLSQDSMLKCQACYGQISIGHSKAKLCSGCHILVATPGRLKDFVERNWIGFKNIKFIILDEGDRLVDEGFNTVVREFFNHEQMPGTDKRQTFFFSATFNPATQIKAKEYLKDNYLFLTVGRVGAANENIKQEFIQVERNEKKRELKKILQSVPEQDKTIVFTQTKVIADILAGFFSSLNLSSTSIHGDRQQSQREEAISMFKRGQKRFLISSPVGNRGLDLPKVALVINYDLPKCIDEYVHRIGRTGRAGHTGRAISFYDSSQDSELLPDLINILKEAKQEVPDWMLGGSADTGDVGGGGGADDWGESSSTNAQGSNSNTNNNDDWGEPAATTNNSDNGSKAAAPADDDWGEATTGNDPPPKEKETVSDQTNNESEGW